MNQHRMKAVALYGTGKAVTEEVEIPKAGPGEAIIRIEAAGICAGDRIMYEGKAPWGEVTTRMVLGHEYIGVVTELGEGAAQEMCLQLGDRCLAEVQIPCMKCYYCRHGWYNLCDDPNGFLEGGWAEYMRIRRGAIVHKVPKSIDRLEAAMIEPLSCSAHGVERADISMKDVVVISGMGAIGLGMIQFAKLKTPYKLIGLDVNDRMLEMAKRLGADYVLNPTTCNVQEAIRELTDGRGADIYIEASGNGVSLETGLEVLRKRGRMVAYGVYAKPAVLDFNMVSENKELEIRGGHLSPGTYPFVIQCLERGLVTAKPLVTDVYTFDEIEAALNAKKTNPLSIKTVLVPPGSMPKQKAER